MKRVWKGGFQIGKKIINTKKGRKTNENKRQNIQPQRPGSSQIPHEEVVERVVEEAGPRRMLQPQGCRTRAKQIDHDGDAAEVAQIELVGSEFDPKKAEAEKAAKSAETEAPKQQKSVAEQLKAAAQSIRGGKKDAGQAEGGRGKASKPARGAAKKSTTPRKAGGS